MKSQAKVIGTPEGAIRVASREEERENEHLYSYVVYSNFDGETYDAQPYKTLEAAKVYAAYVVRQLKAGHVSRDAGYGDWSDAAEVWIEPMARNAQGLLWVDAHDYPVSGYCEAVWEWTQDQWDAWWMWDSKRRCK